MIGKADIPPLFFRPYKQDDKLADMHFYVRTATDPADFLTNIPKLISGIDPNLPVEDLRTLPQQMRDDVTKVVLDMPTKGKEAFQVLTSGLSTGFAPGDVKDYQPIIDMVQYNAEHHIGETG